MRFRRRARPIPFRRPGLFAIGHDHVEESLGGRPEQVRQVIADDSQSQVGGVLERFGAAHEVPRMRDLPASRSGMRCDGCAGKSRS